MLHYIFRTLCQKLLSRLCFRQMSSFTCKMAKLPFKPSFVEELHIELVGKPVLTIIEFFVSFQPLTGITAEILLAEICLDRHFIITQVTLGLNFMQKETSTNHCQYQKLKDCPCIYYQNIGSRLGYVVLSQSMDRQKFDHQEGAYTRVTR